MTKLLHSPNTPIESRSDELDVLFDIKMAKLESGKVDPYALFVVGKGFLNSDEAIEYLDKKLKGE